MSTAIEIERLRLKMEETREAMRLSWIAARADAWLAVQEPRQAAYKARQQYVQARSVYRKKNLKTIVGARGGSSCETVQKNNHS